MSPDHKTLLVLTSGYNRVYNANTPIPYGPDSNEYVFIYDISTPTPIKKQVVQIANSYNGIVFDPSGAAFYVAGGVSDNVQIITLSADGTWGEPGPALALGQKEQNGREPCRAAQRRTRRDKQPSRREALRLRRGHFE